jgi:hypothetical protein
MNTLAAAQQVNGFSTLLAKVIRVRLNDRLTLCCYTPPSFMVHAILGVRPPARDMAGARIPRVAWT